MKDNSGSTKKPFFKPAQLEAARHIVWYYGHDGGIPPGSFHEALIRAMEHADRDNGMRLLGAFPEYYPAVMILQGSGAPALARIVLKDLERLTEQE